MQYPVLHVVSNGFWVQIPLLWVLSTAPFLASNHQRCSHCGPSNSHLHRPPSCCIPAGAAGLQGSNVAQCSSPPNTRSAAGSAVQWDSWGRRFPRPPIKGHGRAKPPIFRNCVSRILGLRSVNIWYVLIYHVSYSYLGYRISLTHIHIKIKLMRIPLWLWHTHLGWKSHPHFGLWVIKLNLLPRGSSPNLWHSWILNVHPEKKKISES